MSDYISDFNPPEKLPLWIEKIRAEEAEPTYAIIIFDLRQYSYEVIEDEGRHRFLEVTYRRGKASYMFSEDTWDWWFNGDIGPTGYFVDDKRLAVRHKNLGPVQIREE